MSNPRSADPAGVMPSNACPPAAPDEGLGDVGLISADKNKAQVQIQSEKDRTEVVQI